MADSEAYLSRGVSPTKGEVHAAIRDVDAGLFPGAFCKVVADPNGDEESAVVMHADGAGTKSTLAYIDYKESGSADAFVGIAQDSTVMNLDDVACVGAVTGFLLSNTIGRNAHRCGGDVIAAIVRGYSLFAEKMAEHGVQVVLTGGETADVGDLVQTVIVDSTLYVRFPREQVINAGRIRPGHVIVGLSSSGQATYESSENSGIGSNGLTLARHVLLASEYTKKYPETFSPTISADKVYCGKYLMGDPLPGSTQTAGEALLSPTRSYLPILRKIYEHHRPSISGVIHCTGGGQAKNRNFGDCVHFVKEDLFEPPPIFQAIQESAGIDTKEMLEAFNMGHRLEVICDRQAASAIIGISESFGVSAKVVGEVRPGDRAQQSSRVTIRTAGRDYEYS